MQPIISTSHANPLLEDFDALQPEAPEEYQGFIYMWKCIPEELYYIGSHKGRTGDDYRGSGKRFRQVFEHYGITQFERVILEYVDDSLAIKAREQYWLNQFNAIKSKKFLNEKNAIKF
jgi:hypothetical protein